MTNLGEQYAYNYLKDIGYTVQDVTQNPAYYGKDIDFIVTKDNQSDTIEVKWDSRISNTGNMFIETSSDINKRKDGWFRFCEADYLFYGDSVNKLFYVISMEDIKDYLDKNYTEERCATDYRINGAVRKISRGDLIPIDDFKRKYKVNTIYLETEQQIRLNYNF